MTLRDALLVLLMLPSDGMSAQEPPFKDKPETVARVVVGNVAIGGVTAALRALINGNDVPKAFVAGAVGGAVHISGKMISMGSATPGPIAGMLVSSVGASMVANAGRGGDPFDELFVPIGPLRLRVTPRAASHVKLSVCAYDVLALADRLHYREMAVDWKRTARAGTFVFTTPRQIILDGGWVDGVTFANVIVLSELSENLVHIQRHEYVHVQQYLFVQEAWGRPLEGYLRSRSKLLRRLPTWLELGIGEPVIGNLDHFLYRKNSLNSRLRESEAEALSR